MQSSTPRSTRRRIGALVAGAVLAGGTLTSSPALAAPSGGAPAAPAASPTAASPLAAAQAEDPNADGYDSFIVTYKETAANAHAKGRANAWGKAAKEAGVSVKELRETALGSRVITADRKLDQAESAKFMADLKASGAVEAVEPDAILTATGLSPVDALYSQQWGFTGTHGMRVPGTWDRTTGSGATVAVIDTGITSHPDLDRNVVPGYDFISDSTAARDGGGRDSNPRDEGDWYAAGECGTAGASDSSWHGSHVAGTVAAVADSQGVVGVAPNAKIQPIRVLGRCGGSLSDIADAVVWAAGGTVAGVPANPNPADVINMSLGGSGVCGTTYQNAINAAVSRGAPVVVAAGNENQPAANVRPANCRNTIVVAASTSQGARASFSNYGSAVDVTAPGANIISTVNNGATTPTTAGHAAYNGTSMATPHVAGLAGLLLATKPSLTPAQVESTLTSTARSMPVTCSAGCGAGLADATAAVSSLGGAQTEPEPTPAASSIVNGGFESGSTGWTGTPAGFARTDAGKAASGQAFAQLNGVGRRSTATVEQKVTVPASGATLTYALQVDTAETTASRTYDLLDVQVVGGTTGTSTVAAHSNLDRGGYATHTVDLSRFAGTTVTLRFRGTEDSTAATTFRIDEVAVTPR